MAFTESETCLERQEYFSQFQDTTDALLCHILLPVCLWIMDPHSRAPKKNTSHGNEVLPQDTTHPIQRPCYQRGSLCLDPARNRTTRRPPDHCTETQIAVVGTCLLFIRSGQNHLAGYSEKGKKTRQTEKRCCYIKEWTRLEFAKSKRAVKNREIWRKLVVKSSVVPHRPPRLSGRWRWRANEHRSYTSVQNLSLRLKSKTDEYRNKMRSVRRPPCSK